MLKKTDIGRTSGETLSIIHLRKDKKCIIKSLAFFENSGPKYVFREQKQNFDQKISIIYSLGFFQTGEFFASRIAASGFHLETRIDRETEIKYKNFSNFRKNPGQNTKFDRKTEKNYKKFSNFKKNPGQNTKFSFQFM